MRLRRDGGRDRQRQPQHDVLEHGDAEDEARETCVQDLQVGKDFRHHRHRSDGDAHRQNDDQGHAVAVRSGQARTNEMGPEGQPEQERYAGPDDDEPTHGPALAPAEQLLHLGAGDEHQQQEPEPVDETEDLAIVPGGAHEVLDERQPAQQRRTECDAGQDLPTTFG